jgi:hypothetical protein
VNRALLLLALAACGDSVTAKTSLEEPIRVGYLIGSTPFAAQFFPGPMPAPAGGPPVAGVDIGPSQVAPGKQDKGGYVVRVDKSAYAVAIRLKDRDNGYWIARVDQPEALFANQVSASLTFSVSPDLPPGGYQLEIAGVNGASKFGDRVLAPLTVVPRVPAEATTIIQLRWDAKVDLDLQLKAPDGTLFSPKQLAPFAQIDGDSVANCIDDGLREENIYFTAAPAAGRYAIYVNPFSLCGELGTTYEVTVTRNGAVTDRFYGRVAEAEQRAGGFGTGDFVANVTF